MKWVKILGFALLNTILGIILLYTLAWLLHKYTGQYLDRVNFSSIVAYGVSVATVIGISILESWKARLPFWRILIATVVFLILAGLMLALWIMFIAASIG